MKKYWLTDEEFEKELPELKERARRKEKWKAYPEDGSVEVSNCGRVRQNGQILPMTEKKEKMVAWKYPLPENDNITSLFIALSLKPGALIRTNPPNATKFIISTTTGITIRPKI